MNLNNRVVLIAGGSSGIGLALGRLFADQGAHIWLLARRADPLAAAQVELTSRLPPGQGSCAILRADVTDQAQVEAALAQVMERSGVPDLVVNSAGIARPGYVQDLEPQIFHWMMDVNYFGTVNVIHGVLPGMLERGSGHLVNISSLAGLVGVFGYTAYGAAKFAVTGYSQALRVELKPHGIHVSIVYPPNTETPALAYENQFKPPETRAIEGSAGALSADRVARAILKGIARRQFMIIPGAEGKLLYWAFRLTGSGLYPIMDWVVARARTNHTASHSR